uniref:Putative secreted protein n=1 Tax=Anopheles nuneztovari TaxID=30067 RepID=A0A2M3YWV3_9DIPT
MAEVAVVTTATTAIMITTASAPTTGGATTKSRSPCSIWEEAVRESPETVTTTCRTTISEGGMEIRAAITSATTTVAAVVKAG